MNASDILFYFLSALALGSAMMVVISRNPVHSVLWLIVTFFAISGHYILMNAQFIGIVNLIVYAGAIMVLFLFVIMLMNLNSHAEPQKSRLMKFAGIISGGTLLLVMVAALRNAEIRGKEVQMSEGEIGIIENLGRSLFTDFVVPFEVSSILFLSAMVGAVLIGKKSPKEENEPE